MNEKVHRSSGSICKDIDICLAKKYEEELERLRVEIRLKNEMYVDLLKDSNAFELAMVDAEFLLDKAIEVLNEIAKSDDIDNALDPERNKRIALKFLENVSHD